MKKNIFFIFITILNVLFIILFISGCRFSPVEIDDITETKTAATSQINSSTPNTTVPAETYSVIDLTGDTFTLAWDPPAGDSAPDSYYLYYRVHNGQTWTKFAENLSPAVECIVDRAALGLAKGSYDFGVTAVYSANESLKNCSLDATAIPTTGWYIRWK